MWFYIVELCCLILEYVLTKCGHVIHRFNVYVALYDFLLMTLLAVYFILLFLKIFIYLAVLGLSYNM